MSRACSAVTGEVRTGRGVRLDTTPTMLAAPGNSVRAARESSPEWPTQSGWPIQLRCLRLSGVKTTAGAVTAAGDEMEISRGIATFETRGHVRRILCSFSEDRRSTKLRRRQLHRHPTQSQRTRLNGAPTIVWATRVPESANRIAREMGAERHIAWSSSFRVHPVPANPA